MSELVHIRVDKKTKEKWGDAVLIATNMGKKAGDLFKEMLDFYISRVEVYRKLMEELEKNKPYSR